MTTLQRFLDALSHHTRTQPKQSGNSWRCICPVHPDEHPSLDVGFKDGKVLIVCRSCGANGKAVCEAIGYPLPALHADYDPDSPHRNGTHQPNRTSPKSGSPSSAAVTRPQEPGIDWEARQAEYVEAAPHGYLAGLAERLKVPEEILALFSIGHKIDDRFGPCWTFAEVDGDERVIGILRRLATPFDRDGKKNDKLQESGSNRGLTVPGGWIDRPGPVFITEGASDCIAMTAAGLAAIGRAAASTAKNTEAAEVEYAARLLTRNAIPDDRAIIVVGDNDPSRAGENGARDAAAALSERLGRLVQWTLAPSGVKDVRAWLTSPDRGETVWAERGQQLANTLIANAVPKPPSPRFVFIPSTTFFGEDYRPSWLIPGILVRNQPGIIAGPSKAMKTSILIDLAISLAAGRPFLNKFRVPTPCRVAIISGESGPHTLQETARRVMQSKGIGPDDLGGRLDWCFNLPTFSDLAGMKVFADELRKIKADIAIIDPLYLSLGDVDPRNMFAMGAALRAVAEPLLANGCMPVFVHHANGRLAEGDPMQLSHLSYSGLEQFARQFLLINRMQKYKSDGVHDLLFSVGGSAGHGGLWNVRIEEGITDHEFSGRRWDVTVQTLSEMEIDADDTKEMKAMEAERQKRLNNETRILEIIDQEMKEHGRPASKSRIKDRTNLKDKPLKDTLEALIENEVIVEAEFLQQRGNGPPRTTMGYQRKNNNGTANVA